MERLPEDILLKILNLLPFKSLHSCRWVSKPWLALISNCILLIPLPAADPRCVVCVRGEGAAFLRDDGAGAGDIAIGMSFMPPLGNRDTLTVLDCRNGLVLCMTGHGGRGDKHYVCNPATKSWTLLPHPDKGLTGMFDGCYEPSYLGFKPWASPHYTVLSVEHGGNGWSIYSSRTGEWSRLRCLGGDHVWPWRGRHVTMRRGDAYVVHRRPVKVDTFVKIHVETARFRLAEGEEEDIRFPETVERLIVFPDSDIMPDVYIGRLGDEVRLAVLARLGLTVWRLDGTEWALKRNINIQAPPRVAPDPHQYRSMNMPCTLGFWMPNTVFLFYHDVVYLYDLDTKTLGEARPLVDHRVQFFPFSPCSFEVFVGKG